MIEQIRLAASNDKRPMKNRTYLIIIIIQWNGINEKKNCTKRSRRKRIHQTKSLSQQKVHLLFAFSRYLNNELNNNIHRT